MDDRHGPARYEDPALARRVARRDPRETARESLGTALAEATRIALARADSARQGLALLLASPEFQRR